jgi:hypothetical protein
MLYTELSVEIEMFITAFSSEAVIRPYVSGYQVLGM